MLEKNEIEKTNEKYWRRVLDLHKQWKNKSCTNLFYLDKDSGGGLISLKEVIPNMEKLSKKGKQTFPIRRIYDYDTKKYPYHWCDTYDVISEYEELYLYPLPHIYPARLPLHHFVNMNIRDIIKNYPIYMFLEESLDSNSIENYTLADIINEYEKEGCFYYFTKDFYTGTTRTLTSFKKEDDKITYIKILSLDPSLYEDYLTRGHITFFLVINSLFDRIINSQTISEISWSELKTSPTNKVYRYLIRRYKGYMKEHDGIINYKINIDINKEEFLKLGNQITLDVDIFSVMYDIFGDISGLDYFATEESLENF